MLVFSLKSIGQFKFHIFENTASSQRQYPNKVSLSIWYSFNTREQHIKREKATSNICSNQSLIALSATLYLSLLGEQGFKQTGILSTNLAHLLSKKLEEKGIKTLNKNFFNEFVIEVENSNEFLQSLKSANILGGIKLNEKNILVSVTEMNTEEDIEDYVNTIK